MSVNRKRVKGGKNNKIRRAKIVRIHYKEIYFVDGFKLLFVICLILGELKY